MLIAQEQWLPQYASAIKDAKERWSKGDLIPTRDYKGAARLKTKTIEEMSEDKEKMRHLASTAAKEKVE